MCAEGLGHAELYAGSLDSTRHRDILRHSLIPTFRQFFPDGPWSFQQDNVRFHTTPDTVTYLHEKGVTLIEWPPWSPDLNPIENLWNVLKERVYSRFPQSMEEMEQLIREEWAATDLKFISHICCSMPRRLQLLLDNHGHKISYYCRCPQNAASLRAHSTTHSAQTHARAHTHTRVHTLQCHTRV